MTRNGKFAEIEKYALKREKGHRNTKQAWCMRKEQNTFMEIKKNQAWTKLTMPSLRKCITSFHYTKRFRHHNTNLFETQF